MQSSELTEQDIVEYLQRDLNFFKRHEELLAMMEIPHAHGTAVSLVERQVTVLREENQRLQHKLEDLIAIAQQNEQLNQRIQQLVMILAGVSSIDEFFNNLYEMLHSEFKTDAVVVRLFELPGPSAAGRQEFAEYDAQVFTLFESLLDTNHPFCGRPPEEQNAYFFPEMGIMSAVLIPLGVPQPKGILAMGSKEVSRFQPTMSTDLLKYMGQLISQLLQPWLRS